MTVPTKILAWSWSRYQLYQTCPLKVKLTVIDKLQEPKNEAMTRGGAMHDDARDYITGVRARVTKDLAPAKKELDALRALYKQRVKLAVRGMAPNVEEEWAFTSSWTETEWRNWSLAWLRVKLDAGWWETATRYRVRDWKSGKMNDRNVHEYGEQLELYALAVLLRFPHCAEVAPDLFFIDNATAYPAADALTIFTRKDLPRLKKAWLLRTKRLLSDTKFAPTPGWQCPGCYFNKSTTMGWKIKTTKPAGPCRY